MCRSKMKFKNKNTKRWKIRNMNGLYYDWTFKKLFSFLLVIHTQRDSKKNIVIFKATIRMHHSLLYIYIYKKKYDLFKAISASAIYSSPTKKNKKKNEMKDNKYIYYWKIINIFFINVWEGEGGRISNFAEVSVFVSWFGEYAIRAIDVHWPMVYLVSPNNKNCKNVN